MQRFDNLLIRHFLGKYLNRMNLCFKYDKKQTKKFGHQFDNVLSESKCSRVMTPPKRTIPLLSGLIRAHLVNWLRFYHRFKIWPVFVVLICRFLVQIVNANVRGSPKQL